jgi:uncharacterized transporter YbjL
MEVREALLMEDESEQNNKLETVTTGQPAETAPSFKAYVQKNSLPLIIIAMLLIATIVQAVQISKLRQSVDLLCSSMGVLTDSVHDNSSSISGLKNKLKEDKENQINLIRKMKAEYAAGYNQLMTKEKYLNRLTETSTIAKIETALEHFWQKILASFK